MYAREELRADVAAMMTGEQLSVGHEPRHGRACVSSWIKALENDPREIRAVATDQQDAVDLRTLRTTGWGCPDSGASRSRPGVAGRERRCRTLTRGGLSGSDRPGVGSLMLTTQARDAAGATVPTGTRAEPYGGGRRTSGARPMRRWVTARRGRKGGSTVASVAGVHDVAARCWLLRA